MTAHYCLRWPLSAISYRQSPIWNIVFQYPEGYRKLMLEIGDRRWLIADPNNLAIVISRAVTDRPYSFSIRPFGIICFLIMKEAGPLVRLTGEFGKQDYRPRVLMTRHTIDDEILEACRRGDREAFRQVFEAYKDRVFSIALCFFDGNEAAARDITQDVFLKLMTTISQFQNRSEFSTWLYRLVANACLDRKRSLRRLLFLGGPGEYDVPDRRASVEVRLVQQELESSVRKVIAAMRPRLRMAILSRCEGNGSQLIVPVGCRMVTERWRCRCECKCP
jgi:RNA polymerase sigma-70 factor (ECF subfamily)